MQLGLGICFKCGVPIMKDRRPLSNWTQKGFRLDNGDKYLLALCRDCNLEDSEYKEASSILGLRNKIVDKLEREGSQHVDGLAEVLKEAQGGKCHFCGKPITEQYAISGGHITHERCDDVSFQGKE